MRSNKGSRAAAAGHAAGPGLEDLWAEIRTYLGVCPSFFRLAGDDPQAAQSIWQVARFAYVDLPADPVAKEQLFAYLARFCGAHYCVARHIAFLLRKGGPDGATPSFRMDPAAVAALLDDSEPDAGRLRAALENAQSAPAPLADWPTYEMPLGRAFRDLVTVVFLDPPRSQEAIQALRRLLGAAGFQRLMLFLGFVRLATFWTEVHPDIRLEPDVEALLIEHEALARVVNASPTERQFARPDRRSGGIDHAVEIRDELARLRATEAALAARSEHLDTITAHAPVMLAELDRDRSYRFVNRSYAAFFDSTPGELMGRHVREVIGERAYSIARPYIDAVFRGQTLEFDVEVAPGSGRWRWLRTTYAPLRDGHGDVAGVIAGITDVTEHKREEQARIDSESRLRAAQIASGIGLFDWDVVADRIIWDDRIRAVWGIADDRPIDFATFVAGLHPDDLLATREAVERALEPTGNGSYLAEYRVVHAGTGRTSWVHASGQVDFVDGQAVRMLGAVIDVSARREAEAARARSEERLQLAAEAAGFGTYYQDHQTGELDWSAEARTIMGLDPDEPLTVPRMLAHVHPADRGRLHAKVQSHVRGCGPPEFEEEFRCQRPDGSTRWVLVKGRRYEAPRGAAEIGTGVTAGTFLDITSRKRAEERQKLLMNELNHRVKNMLTVVQSLANQTVASTAADAANFMQVFSARLRALAGAHDLLTRGGWEGATLDDVIGAALAPFGGGTGSDARIHRAGPHVRLSPNAAVMLSLVIHELATNAMKYGALSAHEGRVAIAWSLEPPPSPEFLDIAWVEQAGPSVRPPSRHGFGSRLIERALVREFEGTASMDFAAGGLECRLHLALSDRIREGP